MDGGGTVEPCDWLMLIAVLLPAVQDGHLGQALGSYQSPVHAVRTMLQREGWRAFYNGLVPAILGSGALPDGTDGPP